MTAVMTGHAPIGADLGSALAIARARCERIRKGMESFIATRRDVAAAYAARDWATLGYESFDAYLEGEFSEARLKLTPEERREAVAELRLAGMSQPAIGSVLGVSQSTVRNDLAQLSTSTKLPETVTGTDGKERPATRLAADPKPDLAPTILEALTRAGRDGLDQKVIAAVFPEQPAEKDLLRALEKLVKSGEVVVTATWANKKPRKWAAAAAVGDLTPDVERVLGDAGLDGRTSWQIAFLLAPGQPGPEVAALAVRVASILEDLAADGKACGWDADGGMRWALPEQSPAQTPAMEDSADVPTHTDAPYFADLDAQLDAEMEGTDQRFRRNFSSAIVKAVAIWQFDVDRIAQAYAGDFDREILPHLDEMERWCNRVRAARKNASGLRLVNGGAR